MWHGFELSQENRIDAAPFVGFRVRSALFPGCNESTPQRISKSAAGFGHPSRFELHDRASECLTWDGVEVVEIHYTLRGNAVVFWIQLQLRNKTPAGSRKCGYDN